MADQNIVPVRGANADDRRAELRRARAERRRALAMREARTQEPVPVEDPDYEEETQPREARRGRYAEPVIVSAETFALPPRAQLESGVSAFGRFTRITFAIGVVAPTIVAILFYLFVATDQYATESAFAVRSPSTSSSSLDITAGIGGLAAAMPGSEVADSHILQAYIESREMVEALIKEGNFLEIYSRPSADQYYRLDPTQPIESLVSYWQMMSSVEYDLETGIMNLTIRAFRPADAEAITAVVIRKSEELVNELSRRAREDSVRTAQREVNIAEQRFKDARQAVASYRGTEQEIDPTATATARQTILGSLQSELAKAESSLTALRKTMSDNSPRVVYVRTQIEALKRQIEAERKSVAVADEGDTQPVLTDRLSRYEELLAERDFAERAYVSSLATLEAARIEALKQQRYLAVFVRGSAPEYSTYPEAFRWTAILFGSLLAGWGLIIIIGAAIRDRMA
jgi:capsular polysaccharide transport system permease protein